MDDLWSIITETGDRPQDARIEVKVIKAVYFIYRGGKLVKSFSDDALQRGQGYIDWTREK